MRGGTADPEGLESLVDVLVKKKTAFPSAAAYNLRILDSMLSTGGVDKDAHAFTRLEAAGGLQAVLACLENCRCSAGTSLLQAGGQVLNRVLVHRPNSAATISQLGGARIIVNGLRDVEDRPVQAIELLGLMAEGGQAVAVVEAGSLDVVMRLLEDGLAAADEEVTNVALLALGRIFAALRARPHGPLSQGALKGLEANWKEAMTEAVLRAIEAGGGGKFKMLEPAVSTLLWLAEDEPKLLALMARHGLHSLLLESISYQEGESSEGGFLYSCGQLFDLLVTEHSGSNVLDLALARAKALSPGLSLYDIKEDEDWEEDQRALAVLGAAALSLEGRQRVMHAEGVVDVLLQVCDQHSWSKDGNGVDGVGDAAKAANNQLVRLALRVLERLAADPMYGRELLQTGAMDKAMAVLKCSTTDDVPGEIVAAAASVVARLTRVMVLRGLGQTGEDGKYGRRSSFGYSEAKVEALHFAISAYGRHPNNMLLFKGLLDLAFSNIRRGDPDAPIDELVQSSVDALLGLTDMNLPASHQAVLRDRLWCNDGVQTAIGCLGVEAQLTESVCRLLVAGVGSSKARELPFLLHYSEAGEDLYNTLSQLPPGDDRDILIELVKPVLELKPKPPVTPQTPTTAVTDESAHLGEAGGESDEMGIDESSAPMSPSPPSAVFDLAAAAAAAAESESLGKTGGSEAGLMLPDIDFSVDVTPWVQALDHEGLAYFLNLSSGVVQWDVPADLTDFWDSRTRARPQVTVKELTRWVAKVDPDQRVVYYEDYDEDVRQWRLPADVPVSIGTEADGSMSSPHRINRGSLMPAADEGDADLYAFERDAEPEEEEEEDVSHYLEELLELRRDMDPALASQTSPGRATLALKAGHYIEVAKDIRDRKSRKATELEGSLASSLGVTLRLVDDLVEGLAEYKGMYERELAAHERKGVLAPLEATMAQLKGEVLRHTPSDLPAIIKIVGMMEKYPGEVEKIFKESHLLIKRLVVDIAGEQAPNTHWTLQAQDMDRIPELYWQQLSDSLRYLVLAYDNMSDEQKSQLTTTSEIIKNRDHLVDLAVRCSERTAMWASLSMSGSSSRRNSFSAGSYSSSTSRNRESSKPASSGYGQGHNRGAAGKSRLSLPGGSSFSSDPGGRGIKAAADRRRSEGAAARGRQQPQQLQQAQSPPRRQSPGRDKAPGSAIKYSARPMSSGSVGTARTAVASPSVSSVSSPSLTSPDARRQQMALASKMRFDNFAGKGRPIPATSTVDKRTPLDRKQLLQQQVQSVGTRRIEKPR